VAEMSLIQQAGSILETVRSGLKDGRVLATKEVIETRLAICEACPKLKTKTYPSGKVWVGCLVCGCGYKKKVSFHGSKCPLEKW